MAEVEDINPERHDAAIRADREQEVWLVPQLAAELGIPANPADREPGLYAGGPERHKYRGNRSQDTCWVGAPDICGKPIDDSVHERHARELDRAAREERS